MLEVAAEERQDAARLAVEAAPEPDDLRLGGRRLREPQRGLHRLRAARVHLDAREPLGRDRGQELEEPRARLGGEAPEGQALHLTLERLDVVRMAVADAADGDPRDEVDVLVAVLVDQRAARAAGHRQARLEREGLAAGRLEPALALDDRLRARPRLSAHRRPPRKRSARWAAIRGAASSRNRAKLGHAFTSSSTIAPSGVTMASPP